LRGKDENDPHFGALVGEGLRWSTASDPSRQGILDRRFDKVAHQPKRHDRYQADNQYPAHGETPLVSRAARFILPALLDHPASFGRVFSGGQLRAATENRRNVAFETRAPGLSPSDTPAKAPVGPQGASIRGKTSMGEARYGNGLSDLGSGAHPPPASASSSLRLSVAALAARQFQRACDHTSSPIFHTVLLCT
jgi:hypothetical protein